MADNVTYEIVSKSSNNNWGKVVEKANSYQEAQTKKQKLESSGRFKKGDLKIEKVQDSIALRAADAAAAWNKQNAHSAQDAAVFKDDKDGQVAKRAWISHFETGLKHAHAKWEQANKRSDYRRTNEIEKDISKLEKALNDVKANKYPDKDQMALGKEWYNNY